MNSGRAGRDDLRIPRAAPLIAQLCARTRRARVNECWLATSSDPADDVTEAWRFELGLRVFRGESRDVLSRFLAIGAEAGAEWIVRLCADNPFLDAKRIDILRVDAHPEIVAMNRPIDPRPLKEG